MDMPEYNARIHKILGKVGILESAIFLACKANMRSYQTQRYSVENLDDILAKRPMLGGRLRCFDVCRLRVKVFKSELHLL